MIKSTETDRTLIERAFEFAQKAHAGHKRLSGDDYITHPVAVAKILADLKVDAKTIAAGLLHDCLEDTPITAKEIKSEFGEEIFFLVAGVTKLGKLKYQGLKRHVESLRKFFIAMTHDLRVVTIRLADRLHNLQTLKYLPAEKQKRIAMETIEIYAPIANRLGIWKLKGQLEDLSFPYVYPAEYKKVTELRKTKGRETIKRLEKIYRSLNKELADKNLPDFQIDYRIKYLYSLYTKLKRHQMDIEKIYDISAIRVIVNTVEECYQVLGIIHSKWRPVPGKLKDYIAIPKPNGYQSIHTSVFTGDGIVEIQIRTKAMHDEALYGIASHIAYDESGKNKKGSRLNKKTKWLNDILELHKQVGESEEFLKIIKSDFFKDRIFVFTPKGDVIELPTGATALDFAYAIHSDIGNHAVGAVINGKFAALNKALFNNDVIRIETSGKNHPTVKWLKLVTTNMARRQIKNYLHKAKLNQLGLQKN